MRRVPLLAPLVATLGPALAQDPSDATRAEVEAFLGELRACFLERDGAGFIDRVDVPEMLDAMGDLDLGVGRRIGLSLGLRSGMRSGVERGGHSYPTGDWELRAVEPGADADRVRAIVRTREPQGVGIYVRWYLVRDDEGWRVYDWEDLDGGLRASVVMGGMLAGGEGGVRDVRLFLEGIQSLQQYLLDEDLAQADVLLARLSTLDLPAYLEAIYWLNLSALRSAQWRHEEALEALDRAEELSPDMPILDYQRATLLLDEGRPAESLVFARRYAERLGGDADIDLLIGAALESLGRTDEAFAVVLRGLDDDPSSADLVGALVRVCPEDRLGEVDTRFRALTDAPEWFDWLAGEATAVEAWPALGALCDALDDVAPRDPNVEYYRARVLVAEGRAEEASRMLLGAFERSADERSAYVQAWAEACAAGGREAVLEGFEQADAAGCAAEVFPYLAGELLGVENVLVRDLAERYAALAPQVHVHHFYAGSAWSWDEEYGPAEEAYERAMHLVDAESFDAVHEERIDNLVRAERVAEAYQIEPRPESWYWILDSCYWWELGGALEAALALRSADRPGDPELPAWEGFAAWLAGDVEAAVEALDRADLELERFVQEGYRYGFLAAQVRGLVRLERYERALELARLYEDETEDPLLVAVVEVLRGDEEGGLRALRRTLEWRTWEELLEDEDLAGRLERPPYASLR